MAELPSPQPADPLPLVREWLATAAADGRLRNPTAMALATHDGERPSVRMVLLKALADPGYVVFYTNYGSRKALEIERVPRAAAVLYWEALGRQLRFEGVIARSPAAESDAYFATRPFRSQLNAWASAQSETLVEPADLESRAAQHARDLVGPAGSVPRALPRPPFWGGFRLWLDMIELWVEGTDRFHERLQYRRDLEPTTHATGPWQARRLQP